MQSFIRPRYAAGGKSLPYRSTKRYARKPTLDKKERKISPLFAKIKSADRTRPTDKKVFAKMDNYVGLRNIRTVLTLTED